MQVYIRQITSGVTCGKDYVGKWYASTSKPGPDGDPVHRHLQEDGTWSKNAKYFNSKQEIDDLLLLEHEPDFSLSSEELYFRQVVRNDSLLDLDDAFDDDYRPY